MAARPQLKVISTPDRATSRLHRLIRQRDGLRPTFLQTWKKLAGADEATVQALGASAPVLSMFPQDFAALSPDLVHEAERAVGRR